jgi:diguanylate cyclase
MDQWAQREDLLRAALGCYRHALEDIEESVFQIFPEKFGEAAPAFSREKQILEQEPGVESLAAVRERLHGELAGAGEKLRRCTSGTAELREVLAVLAQTAASLETAGRERVKGLTEFAGELRSAAAQPDAAQLRRSIIEGIQTINSLVEAMSRDNAQMLSRIESQMAVYRKRVEEAERRAREDPLTGLGNRRLLEEQAAALIAGRKPLCLLIIDLNRFKAINDKHGHPAGDALLTAFAMRLRNSLRASDVAIRYGGDEFVVLLPCSLLDAMARARTLDAQLRGDYRLECGQRPVRITLGLSIGVAEHRAGETVADLLRRADQLLYHAKPAC